MILASTDQASELRALMQRCADAAASQPAAHTPRRVPMIAVSSGKGGVGKTHLAVNLACTIARAGTRVLLIDADAGTANADLLLGVTGQPTLADLLYGRCPADRLPRRVAENLHFVSETSGEAGPAESLLADPLWFGQIARDLSQNADLIVVDCAAGVGPTVRGPAGEADLLVVVTTAEATAMTDAYALIKVVHQGGGWISRPALGAGLDFRLPRGCPLTAVVVNQVYRERDGRAIADRLVNVARRFLGVELAVAGCVRFDRHVPAALVHRRPFTERYPRCRAACDVAALSRSLLGLLASVQQE